jgi:hypothetical protein
VSQHMVIFQNPDGDPGYNQFESVEEAVSFVEQIRNDQGIDSIRIFELNEVKFELKPYYKVELQALNAGAAPSRPAPAPQSPFPAAAAAPAPQAPFPAAAPAPSPIPDHSTSPFSAPEPTPSYEQPAPAPAAPAPAAAAPVPPADQPSEDGQPTRRGLFGR